jgi:hypothetical protein
MRQEQGEHDGRHEEHGQERHAAPQLDEGDGERPDDAELGAPAERQKDAERKGARDGDEGDDDVEHQPSPLAGVNIGQARHAADQQGAGEQGKYGEQQKERQAAMAGPVAQDRHAEGDHESGGEGEPPQLGIGIVAPEEGVQAKPDEGPAGAVAGAG